MSFIIRPKGRLFDDENNPSLPADERSFAGDLGCCSNGKTLTEYLSGVDADDFTIVEDIPNRKTTWTTKDTVNTITWEIHFIACCAGEIRFEYTGSEGEFGYAFIAVYVRKPTKDNALDYGRDFTLLFQGSAEGGIDIKLEELAGAGDFFPADECGTHVWFDVQDGDKEGEVFSFTLG